MKEFGIIGKSLSHSLSQKYFTEKFINNNINDVRYSLHPISEVSKLIKVVESHKNLIGLNVTTPYKELTIPYLNYIDPVVQKIGAVNTIKIKRENGKSFLKGYNTDIYGIEKTFSLNKVSLLNAKAIILGSGGSAKTLEYFFSINNIGFIKVSRSPFGIKQIAYNKLNKQIIDSHNIIINATPVGMFPNVDKYPDIPYQHISSKHICIDLIYNPSETVFLQKCKQKQARTINGLTMFYEQAEKSWRIWNDDAF